MAPAKTEPKVGFYTSEFVITALVIVCATILLGLDKITSENWMVVAGSGAGIYTIGRTIIKK